MISHRQCINPLVSVEPIYIAGRLRTASSPPEPADAAPHSRGFPLQRWQLARAESTSREASKSRQKLPIRCCVGHENLMRTWHPRQVAIHRIRYTTVIGPRGRAETTRGRRDVENRRE